VRDPLREEEPGKILHELRRGEMARTGESPHAPYYGSIDATPLFLIAVAEAYRWSGDEALLLSLWPAAEAALSWMEEKANERGDGFLWYRKISPRGLDNQGWKDSAGGVPYPDGRRAPPPIALVEVQGYAVAARRLWAHLHAVRGDAARAAVLEEQADRLQERLAAAFYIEELGSFALALDGDGVRVPTLASNPGHLLFARAVSSEAARRIATQLLAPPLFSGWGIRTLAATERAYNPLGYHTGSVWPHDNALIALGLARYGLDRAVDQVAEGLHAVLQRFPEGRLPELFSGLRRSDGEAVVPYPVACSPQAWASGSLFMLLQAQLGLEPDVPAGLLRIINPRLPAGVTELTLSRLRLGPSELTVRFARTARRTYAEVVELQGKALKVQIELE
jgi:glycogen debranching enzyme